MPEATTGKAKLRMFVYRLPSSISTGFFLLILFILAPSKQYVSFQDEDPETLNEYRKYSPDLSFCHLPDKQFLTPDQSF